MSLPRPILPGRVYLVTRRCSQRQFLLRPDDKTNQAFLYCLAQAADRFGLEIVGWLAMSNHYHAVVHDPLGRLPDFACHFHQMLAKCLNVRWSRWENLWSSEPPTYTLLVNLLTSSTSSSTSSSTLSKIISSTPSPIGRALRPGLCSAVALSAFERPRFFFRSTGVMPKTVNLKTVIPPGFDDSVIEWAARVGAAVVARERELRAHRAATGLRVLGRKAVRSASAFDRPKTSTPRRELRPFVACRNMWTRLAELRALQRFRRAYHAARQLFVSGVREVIFPPGTFALQRLGALCEPGS